MKIIILIIACLLSFTIAEDIDQYGFYFNSKNEKVIVHLTTGDILHPDFKSKKSTDLCLTTRKLQVETYPEFSFLNTILQKQSLQANCVTMQTLTAYIKTTREVLMESVLQAGFITSSVVVYAQQVAGGLLDPVVDIHIVVVKGVIDSVILNPLSQPAIKRNYPLYLHNALTSVKGEVFNVRNIDNDVENLKRLRSLSATLNVEPSKNTSNTEGLSNIIVNYQETFPFYAKLSLNNNGSDKLGIYQSIVTFGLDNLLGLNDNLQFSLTKSLFNDKSQGNVNNYSLNYAFPFGKTVWTIGYAHFEFYQKISGLSVDLEYQGEFDSFSLGLSRLLFRDSFSKLYFDLNFREKNTQNFIDFEALEVSQKTVQEFDFGLKNEVQLGSGIELDSSLYLTNIYYDSLIANTINPDHSSYVSFNGNLLIPFSWITSINESMKEFRLLSYLLNLQLQLGLTPLSVNDQFSVGSRATVRGFNGDLSLSSESGFMLKNHLFLNINPLAAQFYLHLDYGYVFGRSANQLAGHYLLGSGFGLKGSFLSSLNYSLGLSFPLVQPRKWTHQKAYVIDVSLNFSL